MMLMSVNDMPDTVRCQHRRFLHTNVTVTAVNVAMMVHPFLPLSIHVVSPSLLLSTGDWLGHLIDRQMRMVGVLWLLTDVLYKIVLGHQTVLSCSGFGDFDLNVFVEGYGVYGAQVEGVVGEGLRYDAHDSVWKKEITMLAY